jgi:hypothetical protein
MKTKQSNKNNQGMVLIVALIMLAMVTFMVVAFLAFARVDRSSVAMSMRAMEVDLMGDSVQARVQAIMYRVMNGVTVPFANGAGVSQNVDGNGTTREYTLGELTRLQTYARPPVYVDTNGDGVYDEFRYFLNLNQDINATGGAIYQPTTPEEIGDPHWIGVLEDSNRPHGPDNRFVARYAYLVVPTDQQLDINRVHNKDKSIFDERYKVYSEGYQRLQGNACWEMNLAGALAMIDSQRFNYEEYKQMGNESSRGRAFEYAGGPHFELPVYAGLWNYRYPKNYFTRDRRNQREFIDMLVFLKEPGLKDVPDEVGNPTDYEYLHDYFKKPGQGGRAFYDMLGSITTHAAVSPTTHLSPQTMKPILGMPPTEKLLINKFFTDNDFYHPGNSPTFLGRINLTATKFEVNEAVGTAVAEVILFDENHGLTTGQNVFFNGGSAGVESTLYHPGSPDSVPSRELYVEVLDSKRVTLWDVPVRPGNPMVYPTDNHKVLFRAYQRNEGKIVYDAMGNYVPVRDLSAFPEEFSLSISYDPLAKKFTQLASLMLQNAMVRTSPGLGENFHIGSDPNLILFDNEDAATYFGANNIQIYPPSENNFTPEVQRLLQVALNLAEVYSPDYAYDITGDGVKDLKLAWPLVFRPIISHEAGDKVYIAGWRRVGIGMPINFSNAPWWTNRYNLPASVPSNLPDAPISPLGWLGELPDRTWVPADPTAVPPTPSAGVPPVSGNGVNRFPLLIGVNKRTQVELGGQSKIWPSVNELSASVTMKVDHASGAPTAGLRVRVELRDNLYALLYNVDGLNTGLKLRLLVKGTISGTLNGRPFSQPLDCNQYLSGESGKPGWPVFNLIVPMLPLSPNGVKLLTPGIPPDRNKRFSWKVDNLRLKADIVILCADPNYPTLERIVDISRVNFSADLPPQWKTWQANRKYKSGDQTEFERQRYYARRDHESFDFAGDFEMEWKPAIWNVNETFSQNEIIRCRDTDGQYRLYRCRRQHTTSQDPSGRFLPTLAAPNGQLLWAQYTGETYEMSWQVNDPLVDGMSRDYTLVHPLVPNNVHPLQPPYILYDGRTSNNLGYENYVYRPWNVADTRNLPTPNTNTNYSRPWADSYDHISLKDPGIFSEQSWMFPHKDAGGIKTLGWLGLVHRGTPWQSVYLKSKPANRLLIRSIDAVSGVITADSVPFFWQDDRVKLEGNRPLPSQPLYRDGITGIGGNIRYDYSNPQQAPYTLTLWDATFTINKLQDFLEGYTHKPNDPASWLYLISTDAWQRQTGTLDTLPTNDHRLVDIFSTPPSGNNQARIAELKQEIARMKDIGRRAKFTAEGYAQYQAKLAELEKELATLQAGGGAQASLLSVNAKSPAAWAAVLSGVAVPKSKKKGITLHYFHRKHPGNCTETDCVRFGYRLAPNQSMRDLVKSINEHRVLHGGDQDNKNFERVSDILSVPKLTISQPAYQAMIARREVDRAEAPERPDWWAPYYPDELDYERIPQQILSLLRTDSTPRFVAYVFSQTLKPARGSLDEDGLCSNYAIDREAARRTVFRIEGMEKLREYHYRKKWGLPNPNPDGGDEPPSTRVVKESTVPLKLR